MTQSFKCQKCGLPVPAKDGMIHPVTGDRYYVCPDCGAKNRVTRQPTPEGAPVQFVPSGLIADEH